MLRPFSDSARTSTRISGRAVRAYGRSGSAAPGGFRLRAAVVAGAAGLAVLSAGTATGLSRGDQPTTTSSRPVAFGAVAAVLPAGTAPSPSDAASAASGLPADAAAPALAALRLRRQAVTAGVSRSSVRSSLATTAARPSAAAAVGAAQATARAMLAQRGWSGQWTCLNALWKRESGWRSTASNPSGAYGIPQALPGRKMASAGRDWRTSAATQIRWGLGYIAARYGTPCRAWAHSRATGWY